MEETTKKAAPNVHEQMEMVARLGKSVTDQIEVYSKDPMKIQEEFLLQLIKSNAETEYGKTFGFSEINSIEDFRKKHPITTYDHYSEYIEREVNGEKNVLLADTPVHFSKTSGTVGNPKKIPLNKKMVDINLRIDTMHLMHMIAENCGYDIFKGRFFNLSEGTCTVLPSGATLGSASALPKSNYSDSAFSDDSGSMFTSPVEASVPRKGTDTRYLHSRFALMEPNVTLLICTFSSFAYEILRYIEKNWKVIVDDIENGTISEQINIPDESRETLMRKIKPMPERAAELRRIFSEGFETPFIPKVWPNMKCMLFVGGSTFATYTDNIKRRYAGPEMQYCLQGINSSECKISTPYEMNNEDSMLIVEGAFFEFLPLDRETDRPLTLDEVEVGGQYEIMVTSSCGFYRYKMGDAVEVTGFYNKLPLIRFLYRVNQTVSITGEKTTEAMLRFSVSNACEELKLQLVDYSLYPDPDNLPMRYVFLVEVDSLPEGVTKEMLRDRIDKYLVTANPSMGAKIRDGICAPSGLELVQPQTYLLYRDIMSMKGISAAQLKPVNIIKNEFQRKFFFGLIER